MEVRCAACGAKLGVKKVAEGLYELNPCASCLEEEYRSGYDCGYSDCGQSEYNKQPI